MIRYLRTWAIVFAVSAGVVGCTNDDDDDARLVRPDFPLGDGKAYPVENVFFNTEDGVSVGAVFGQVPGQSRQPAVILVHDIGSSGAEWLFSDFFQRLLESDFQLLAIDLRGHGSTPLPNDGRLAAVLTIEDLGDMHLEVRAALTWLRTQPTVDIGRVAVVGNGVGGNVAYVSMGAFPSELRAGVALSPGLWAQPGLEPLLVGDGLDPFAPHTMLYLVGADDALPGPDNQSLSYAAFANGLASLTSNPKSLTIYQTQAHGLNLLQSQQAVDTILSWLETHL